jgi:hypothetical protein
MKTGDGDGMYQIIRRKKRKSSIKQRVTNEKARDRNESSDQKEEKEGPTLDRIRN